MNCVGILQASFWTDTCWQLSLSTGLHYPSGSASSLSGVSEVLYRELIN